MSQERRLFPAADRHNCCDSETGSFSNDDGDGNQDVKKAIGLLRKTTTLHVHHAVLYISLPSLHDYDVKFYGGRKQATTNLFLSLNLSAVLKKATPGKFAYTCHFQQIGINATKIEKAGIHFKTDVFAAVTVVDAKAPYYLKQPSRVWKVVPNSQLISFSRSNLRVSNICIPWLKPLSRDLPIKLPITRIAKASAIPFGSMSS